jgi:hypothetical protein
MPAAPDGERPTEADREPEDFEAQAARNPEVTELVGGHEDADRNDKPQHTQH